MAAIGPSRHTALPHELGRYRSKADVVTSHMTPRVYRYTAYYDHPANTFWERYGQQTVSRLRLEAGAKILDVCCGSGASVIPAAEAVGPNGSVLGIDLAENLIQLARTKAKERRLDNIEFRVADMLDLDVAPSAFDVVICVFGTFFVPDMQQAIQGFGGSYGRPASSLSPPGGRGSSSL